MAPYFHAPVLDTFSILSSIGCRSRIHRDRFHACCRLSTRGIIRVNHWQSIVTHETCLILKTVQKRPRIKPIINSGAEHNAQGVDDLRDEPVALQDLLAQRPIILSVANYASLALLDIAYRAVQPLFLSTPIELRGLGASPTTIGLVLGTFGILNGLFQLAFFAKIVERWGARKLFIAGMTAFIPLWALCPLINLVAQQYGVTRPVWFLVYLQLSIQILMDMSFGQPSPQPRQ